VGRRLAHGALEQGSQIEKVQTETGVSDKLNVGEVRGTMNFTLNVQIKFFSILSFHSVKPIPVPLYYIQSV
jgi:hypothetical protein